MRIPTSSEVLILCSRMRNIAPMNLPTVAIISTLQKFSGRPNRTFRTQRTHLSCLFRPKGGIGKASIKSTTSSTLGCAKEVPLMSLIELAHIRAQWVLFCSVFCSYLSPFDSCSERQRKEKIAANEVALSCASTGHCSKREAISMSLSDGV